MDLNSPANDPFPGPTPLEVQAPAVAAEPLAPVSATERIKTLDVLRGFALLGIFMVNMQFFAMPFMRALFDPSLADAPESEQAAWAIVKVFFEYKFISLFSLLFGIGFSVQLLRARARNSSFFPVFGRRVLVLLCIGIAHALLLWYGDILTIYAFVSVGLMATFWMRGKSLLITAVMVFIFGLVLNVGLTSLQVVMHETADRSSTTHDANLMVAPLDDSADQAVDEDSRRRFRDLRGQDFDPSTDAWMEVETNAYKHGPFLEALFVRAVSFGYGLVAMLMTFGWHVLAMFLLGAGLMKLDFFSSRFARWHLMLVLMLLPLGLVLEGLSAFLTWANGHSFGWHLVPAAALHEVGSVAMMLGYVGLWAVVVGRGWSPWLTGAIASTGRMALTNYLLQTVVATFLMYWWGLGWFGDVTRVQQIMLVLLVYPVQVVASALWMRVFAIGPMEWLWRSLSYLRIQPVRRTSIAS